ncbi:rhomboid family intramembrane serine protease [Catenulispora sp. NF23]|uniref:phosphatidylglycerol lysyltransferase domain-containing protein n=1 Tax=Catenulispora pinistramenti TaxID=2705254 RepID=UPI001BAB51AF|nr:rhomboid family intramembrane serine protease [Catenulispora pinistramenti]MBS2535588.1 rhomboid family intramembrane serine protease [Catenulispora pinistramenti]
MTTETKARLAAAEPPLPKPVPQARQSRPARLLQAARSALAFALKAPMTLGFVVLLLGIALVTRTTGTDIDDTLLRRVGTGAAALADGRWWTPVTYTFWCVSPTALLATVVLALVLLAPAEHRLGRAATAGLFALCQIGGALAGAGLIELGSRGGDLWLSDARTDVGVGPSVGIVGVGLALSATLTALWRRRLRLVLITGALLFPLYDGWGHDVMLLCGAVIGLLAGVLVWGRARRRRERGPSPTAPDIGDADTGDTDTGEAADGPDAGASRGLDGGRLRHVNITSHAETRVLVALFVAATALGSLLAWLSNSTSGPLALYNELFVGQGPSASDIATTCAGAAATSSECLENRAEDLLAGSPAALVLFVPALLLLIVAEGLRRGRRIAWGAALVLEAGFAVVIWRYTAYIVLPTLDASAPGATDLHRFVIRYSVLLVVIPAVAIVVLLLTRGHFNVRAPRWTLLKLAGVAALTFVVAGACYIKFGYDARDQFTPEPTFGQVVADFPKRLLPPAYLGPLNVPDAAFIPEGGVAKALYEYTGPVFWVITLGGLLLSFWRSTAKTKEGAETDAGNLLAEYGGSTLSYMTTWPGHAYWISADGTAAVAYRVIGNIALTTGGPYGEPAARAAAVGAFAEYCDGEGWSPCFYSVTAPAKEAADALGWSSVQVAEDTVLSLPGLEFKGKKWQDVRTALNKASRADITAQWYTFPTAPLAIQEQIRALSEEWVADKGLPEMGFTLGGLDELDDPLVRCLVAVDGKGRLHGVTSWLPSFEQAAPVGWTLDFMRRSADGFSGVMEFLIASAALGFQQEGARFMSLSGAPLARVDRGSQPEGLQRFLDVAGRAMEPVYGFRSLLAFKAKFQPEYQPMYMLYPDPATLPAIGNAIGRAYLPHTTPGQLMRLSRKLVG